MKQIYFTVTNDLTYDQRMHRICHSLATNGYQVTLVGRVLQNSLPLEQRSFQQKRLRCFFNKGFLFYAEYNLRLFFFLFFKKMDAICAIDLDTIIPCFFLSKVKPIVRIYDAHELFTELKEVREQAFVKKVWEFIERFAVPRFRHGYTVSEGLSRVFEQRYAVSYGVVRNVPVLKPLPPKQPGERFLFYGGAVNEGRGLEYLIPAMKEIDYKLVIAGGGNFFDRLQELIRQHKVSHKVEVKGWCRPEELRELSETATLGLALAEKEGLNQYLALPNKFFDYMHSGLPQISMNYPEYEKINGEYKVAVLINDLSIETIGNSIRHLMQDQVLLEEMRQNCLVAREVFCWQKEERKLIAFYRSVLGGPGQADQPVEPVKIKE